MSLQFIAADGSKRYLSGGTTAGAYHSLGKPPQPGGRLHLAEGYATSASIHEATGDPAVVAFSAGNLPAVAQIMRVKFPAVEIIVWADDDVAGVKKANQAAAAVGGRVVLSSKGV